MTRDRRPISEVISDLERRAVAHRAAGQPARRFWLRNWGRLTQVAKEGPATYNATVRRLWRLLASGDDGATAGNNSSNTGPAFDVEAGEMTQGPLDYVSEDA